jgi:hypothetical protein
VIAAYLSKKLFDDTQLSQKPLSVVIGRRGIAGESPHKTTLSESVKSQLPEDLASGHGLDAGKDVFRIEREKCTDHSRAEGAGKGEILRC